MHKLLSGAKAGVVATLAMSMVMLAGDALGLMPRQPPREIVHQILGSRSALLTTAAHFGFGTSIGVAFALAPKLRSVPPEAQGALFGLAVWALNYAGVLPALGILPPPDDAPGRTATMLPAHVVYGATLGAVLR
jgi:uncharacterized membrane protein YagU involved in acid resistance